MASQRLLRTTKKGLPRPISKAFHTLTKTQLIGRQAVIKRVLAIKLDTSIIS